MCSREIMHYRRTGDDRQPCRVDIRVHADIKVAAGSDACNMGTLHGPALQRKPELMSNAELSPREILVAAPRNGAITMGREHALGTLWLT